MSPQTTFARIREVCENISSPKGNKMVEWRSGSAGALQAQGHRFKSCTGHHYNRRPDVFRLAFPFFRATRGYRTNSVPELEASAPGRGSALHVTNPISSRKQKRPPAQPTTFKLCESHATTRKTPNGYVETCRADARRLIPLARPSRPRASRAHGQAMPP